MISIQSRQAKEEATKREGGEGSRADGQTSEHRVVTLPAISYFHSASPATQLTAQSVTKPTPHSPHSTQYDSTRQQQLTYLSVLLLSSSLPAAHLCCDHHTLSNPRLESLPLFRGGIALITIKGPCNSWHFLLKKSLISFYFATHRKCMKHNYFRCQTFKNNLKTR